MNKTKKTRRLTAAERQVLTWVHRAILARAADAKTCEDRFARAVPPLYAGAYAYSAERKALLQLADQVTGAVLEGSWTDPILTNFKVPK